MKRETMPILRFEIDGIRQRIAFALAESQGALQEKVEQTLEETLTEDWVYAEIQSAVRDCIRLAIQDISNNTAMRNLVTSAIVDALIQDK